MNRELMAFLTDPNRLWAIDEATLKVYAESARMTGTMLGARQPRQNASQVGSVVVLDVSGPISHKPSIFSAFFGGASVTDLRSEFRAAMADPSVKAVVFNFDTPGGTVAGIPEFAAEILDARGKKPIIAQADSLMASAGYWLGASADKIISTPSGDVGSVGVITMHADVSKANENDGVKVTVFASSKYKGEMSPYSALTDDAAKATQARIDAAGDEFNKAIAAGRGVSLADARSNFGEGRIVRAADALKAGMIDGVATLEQTLSGLLGRPAQVGMRADADVSEAEMVASVDADRRRRLERY